jgi:cellulose synthase operon protein YhjQ
MTDRPVVQSFVHDQNAAPAEIATLYSQAEVRGTKYWDFSASRTQVWKQFRHPVTRQQPERVDSPAILLEQPWLEDDVQVSEIEPQAASRQVPLSDVGPATVPVMEPTRQPVLEPAIEQRAMTASPAPAQDEQVPEEQARPTLSADPDPLSEESLPQPQVQLPPSVQQVAGYATAPSIETFSPATGESNVHRWYALQSVFAPSEPPVESPQTSLEDRPPVIAVFSLAGGVGKTCLVATLGRALSGLGERVLLADTAAYGLLPFYFGSREPETQTRREGLLRTFTPPRSESDAPVRVLSLEAECNGDGHGTLLEKLVRDGRGVNRILVDVATARRDVTTGLLSLGPMLLVPMLPDMNSVASLGPIEAFLSRANADRPGAPIEPLYLLNQFDPSSPLHLDVREMLRRQLGDRLLPFVLRRSAAVSEALAEGLTVIDYAPGSPAAEDYGKLTAWLRSVAAPYAVGFRQMRWSER